MTQPGQRRAAPASPPYAWATATASYPLAEAGGPLLVGEQRARLLATCMDQCFVDVTDIPCRAGDEVTFFGQSSGGAAMPIQELGKFMHVEGVYFYSFLSPRVARVYEGLEP
ncbi:alanine racemase C-terminal domain-containing protein [Ruthenibacterium lactatiformans]|uniref:alanine racemase C-terminal domain-containing protein n=1 Tax=Ruthenibacterium lactatiformans TaxID=1550024 RepID=UPI0039A2ED46